MQKGLIESSAYTEREKVRYLKFCRCNVYVLKLFFKRQESDLMHFQLNYISTCIVRLAYSNTTIFRDYFKSYILQNIL